VSIINPGFVKSRLTEKNTFDMPFIMEADKAAEIIFEGLLAEKYDITFPIQMKIIFKILQLLPRPIYFFLVRILTKNI
jgi:short-subunit dehydrogenase